MSAGEIASSLVQFVIVVGVTFTLLCLLTSYLRFQRMTDRIDGVGADGVDGATAFQLQIARRLGRAHREPEPFAVILVRLKGGGGGTDEALAAVSEKVHHGIRERDTVLRMDEETLGLVIGGGRSVGGEVAARILDQFGDGAGIRIAVASFPENGERGEALLAAAREALAEEDGPVIRTAGSADAPTGSRPVATPDDPLAAVPAGQRKLLDPVTGVLREGHLGSVLHKRIAQCRKDGLPGTVMAVQIDHLDRYVDHYGPEGVETIFRHLGCYLQGAVREDDLLARHQDDQIVIIMTAAPAAALVAAHRITEGIKQLEIDHAGTRLKVTTSVGLAGYPDHGASSRALLGHAAAALDSARSKGRNLCLVYAPGMVASRRTERDATTF